MKKNVFPLNEDENLLWGERKKEGVSEQQRSEALSYVALVVHVVFLSNSIKHY